VYLRSQLIQARQVAVQVKRNDGWNKSLSIKPLDGFKQHAFRSTHLL
jgi:hypothetical protein